MKDVQSSGSRLDDLLILRQHLPREHTRMRLSGSSSIRQTV